MGEIDPHGPTRVLITGGAGLLGQALIATAPSQVDLHATQRRTPVRGATAHPIDLADGPAVSALWATLRPTLVIHTAFDTANLERDVWQATLNIAAATRECGARLIHLSTDMVFDGDHSPYPESARPAPISDYGRWKARVETNLRTLMPGAAIIRTSLLTRVAPLDERSAWVVESLHRGVPLTLFVDELRMPLAVSDLARQLWEIDSLPADQQGGIWHLVGPELLSRYALGLLLAAREGLDPAGITPASAASHPAPRPRVLHLLSSRADRMLRQRARPISQVLAMPG